MNKLLKRRTLRLVFGVLFLLSALLLVTATVSASHVQPILFDKDQYHGNPTCADLSLGDFEFKKDGGPYMGTYNIDGFNSITVTETGNNTFDWSATFGIDAVIAKGGEHGANVYIYNPEATSDTGLHPPLNDNGEIAGISHIAFCYDYELTVSKTANTSYTREYFWSIDKSVSPAAWDMFEGDSGTSTYTVNVTKTGFEERDFVVSGTITIENKTPFDAIVSSVNDIIAPANCGVTFPYTMAPGATLTCSYSGAAPGGKVNGTNTVTVSTSGENVNGNSADAPYSFGDPTNIVNGTVHVDDTNVTTGAGDNFDWAFSDTGSASYERVFGCNRDAGTLGNTATINETGQSDSASVAVTCRNLTVTKNANTSLTRTYHWDIFKTVSPDTWNLFNGDTGTSRYTVSVDRTGYTDSNWAVAGTITISNNHPTREANLTGVVDSVSGAGGMTVSCASLVVPAGGSVQCSYSGGLPDAADRTNTATATLQNYHFGVEGTTASGTTDYSGTAPVSFANADVTEVNATVTVRDTNGSIWSDMADDSSQTYSQQFACGTEDYAHSNTATISETGDSASATVNVYCHELSVQKDAATTYTRSFDWDIAKAGDQTDLTLSTGQTFIVNYDVTVSATSTDSDWAVSGNIIITNPAPIPASIASVTESIDGATVSCPGDTVAANGGSMTCTYSASLSSATPFTNTATVNQQNHDFAVNGAATDTGTTAYSASAPVTFGNPSTLVDECATVTDTLGGALGTVCAGASDTTMSKLYEYAYNALYLVCGDYELPNTASFVSNDGGDSGSASWTVVITVPCVEGCSLTPGYWKTHSELGPAPYDDTWATLDAWMWLGGNNWTHGDSVYAGAEEPFFLSGQNYWQVLWTAPQGNAYYILAHAYIAAELNFLNGADGTAVQAEFAAATELFKQYTPDQIASMKGRNGNILRAQFIALAGTLDDYNNGLIGPGHCSE